MDGTQDFLGPVDNRKAQLHAALRRASDAQAEVGAPPLIEGLLDQGALSVAYGEPGTGKSFFVLDLATHVAQGIEWRGRQVHKGAVLYVAGEGRRGLQNRIAALEAGAPHNLHVLDAPLDLCKSTIDAPALLAIAEDIAAPGGLALVVVDTLARVMGPGDENSGADLGALIRNLDDLRAATGAHVLVVHHAGKDRARGARGLSALKAALDTEIEIAVKSGSSVATVTKQRDHPEGDQFGFKLEEIEVAVRSDGSKVTSCRVAQIDPPKSGPTTDKRKPLGGNMLRVRNLLRDYAIEKGSECDLDGFKSFARDHIEHADSRARAKAVRVAIEALVRSGFVRISGSNISDSSQ